MLTVISMICIGWPWCFYVSSLLPRSKHLQKGSLSKCLGLTSSRKYLHAIKTQDHLRSMYGIITYIYHHLPWKSTECRQMYKSHGSHGKGLGHVVVSAAVWKPGCQDWVCVLLRAPSMCAFAVPKNVPFRRPSGRNVTQRKGVPGEKQHGRHSMMSLPFFQKTQDYAKWTIFKERVFHTKKVFHRLQNGAMWS